jgi:alpha-1,3-rhamnosyl/mannosyltransferase
MYPQYFTAIQRFIFRMAHFLALRTAGVALAISEATKQDLVRFFHVEPRRISVTPLAADEHFQPPSRAAIEGVRQTYALPDRYVLYFGSNKPHKNLPRLVQAFAKLGIRDQRLGIGLVIAGHWDARYPEAKHIVERFDLQDRVRFIGPVKDAELPGLYGGAELFVFPSEFEGFGLPVLEAMACGAPVVCGDRSSLPEVAGEGALLCDPHDVESLAHAIEQALDDRDLRANLRQRGLARAAQFSWEQTAQRTLSTYQAIWDV